MKKQNPPRNASVKALIDEMRRHVYKHGAIRPALLAQKVLEWADRLEVEISTPSHYLADHSGEAIPLFTLPVRNPSRRELIRQRKELEKLAAKIEHLERVLASGKRPVLAIVEKPSK